MGGGGNSSYGQTTFKRSKSHFTDRITADGRDGWPVQEGRTGWWSHAPVRGRAGR